MKTLKTNLKNKNSMSFFANKVKQTLISSCVVFILLTSCGSDDSSSDVNCSNGLWTQSVQTELNAWIEASQTYAQDQTTVNCQNNKSAGQAYISALEKIKKCVPNTSLVDFDEAIDEARVEINAITC